MGVVKGMIRGEVLVQVTLYSRRSSGVAFDKKEKQKGK
jgi:hypothetical protein